MNPEKISAYSSASSLTTESADSSVFRSVLGRFGGDAEDALRLLSASLFSSNAHTSRLPGSVLWIPASSKCRSNGDINSWATSSPATRLARGKEMDLRGKTLVTGSLGIG